MRQLTIITANQPGELADITGALAAEGINVENIEATSHGGNGVVTLTVPPAAYDHALNTLRENNRFQTFTEDAIVVRVEDRPGALAEIASRFKDAAVNLRSVHLIQRNEGYSLASIVAEDRAQAEALLHDILA